MPLSPALTRFLSAMEYPATRDDLLREAARDGLSSEERAVLRALPEQSYAAAWHVRHRLRMTAVTDAVAPPVAAAA